MASLPVADEWRFALDLAACETATILFAMRRMDRESSFAWEFRVADRRTLRFTDAGKPFPPSAWRWRVVMSISMSIR